MLVILTTLLLCFSCKSTPPPHPPDPQPSADEAPLPVPAEHRVWTHFYSTQIPRARLSKDERALWDRVLTRTEAKCKPDSRLILAARVHAEDIIQSPGGPSDEDLDRLRFSLHRLGNIDYALESQVIRMSQPDRDLETKLGRVRRSAWTHCGVGIAGTGEVAVAVWIAVNRGIACKPIPVTIPVGRNLIIQCRALGSAEALIPYLGLPNQTVEQLDPVPIRLGGNLGLGLHLTARGRYDVELLLQTKAGPKVAALFPIYAGVKPEPRPTVTPELTSESDPKAPDMDLLEYLNNARRRVGILPLKRDFRLDRAALSHSREMAETGFFGHISPLSGSLESRMFAEQLNPKRVAENMARSRSAIRIHRNLMTSPSHRLNILDPGFTHVGIGVVEEGPDLIATEIFARWE